MSHHGFHDTIAKLFPLPRCHLNKPRKKTLFATLAVIAGVVLLAFELNQLHTTGLREGWFWLFIAALLILVGLMELLAKPPEP